jgi:tetratricopeptide (TPR) repeat protein
MITDTELRSSLVLLAGLPLGAICTLAMLGSLLSSDSLFAQSKEAEYKTLLDLPYSSHSKGFRKNELHVISPSPYTHYSFEQATKAVAKDLARGIVELKYARLVVAYAKEGATVHTWLDESHLMVDELNAEKVLADIDRRLEGYRKAAEQRGTAKLSGCYDLILDDQVISTLVDNRSGEPWWWDGSSYQPIAIVDHCFAIKHYNNTELTFLGEIKSENDISVSVLIAESGLADLGKPQEILETRQATLKFQKKIPLHYAGVLTLRGAYLMDSGKFDWALADMNLALGVDRRYALAYALRSQILSSSPIDKMRDGKHALEDANKYSEYLTDSTDRWKCSLTKASALAELGNFDAAVKELESISPEVPEDVKPMFLGHLDNYKNKIPFRMHR